MTYKTNGSMTTKSLTEWFFGKAFLKEKTAEARKQSKKTGEKTFRFFKAGTGFLTITLD